MAQKTDTRSEIRVKMGEPARNSARPGLQPEPKSPSDPQPGPRGWGTIRHPGWVTGTGAHTRQGPCCGRITFTWLSGWAPRMSPAPEGERGLMRPAPTFTAARLPVRGLPAHPTESGSRDQHGKPRIHPKIQPHPWR